MMAQGGARNAVWLDFRVYRFLPLYRAAFIIFDNYNPAPEEEDPGYLVLDDEIRSQDAIIVLTRDDSRLSAPVTFESIREQSLPLDLEDVESIGCHQVMRVSLLTAVQFILDLEQRENTALPNPYNATDRCLSPHTEYILFGTITASDWAEEVLQIVQEKGLAMSKRPNWL